MYDKIRESLLPSRHHQLSPEALAKGTASSQEHALFSGDASVDYSAFENLNKARKTSATTLFAQTKGPDDELLLDKLKANSKEANDVRMAIQGALALDPSYTAALKTFNEHGKATHEMLKKASEDGFGVEIFIDSFKKDADKALAAIKVQQEKETINLTQLFDNNPKFKTDLLATYHIGDQNVDSNKEQFEKIKTNKLADLKAYHEQQIAEFNKATSEAQTKLLQSNQSRIEEMNLIRLITNLNKKNIEEFLKLCPPDDPDQSGLTPEISISEKLVKIQNLDLKDIKKLETLTGKEITCTEGACSFEISRWNLAYRLDPRENIVTDLKYLALIAKASGKPAIIMNADRFGSPEFQKEMAMMEFEACMRVGYEPKNVINKINGNTVEIKEIFKEAGKSHVYENLVALSNDMRSKAAAKPQVKPKAADKQKMDEFERKRDDHVAQEAKKAKKGTVYGVNTPPELKKARDSVYELKNQMSNVRAQSAQQNLEEKTQTPLIPG